MSKEEWVIIQNLVATAAFKQTFNLDAIVEAHPLNAEYKPEIFPGASFRMKKPKTCTLILRTGKMVCTGAKSVRQARKAILKVARELKKGGIVMAPEEPEIQPKNLPNSRMMGAVVNLKAKGLVEVFRKYTTWSRKRKRKFVRVKEPRE